MSKRRPEHIVDFLAGRLDGAAGASAVELPALVALLLPNALHTALARSGAAQLSAGFLQDAADAVATTIWALGIHLLEAAPRCVSSGL